MKKPRLFAGILAAAAALFDRRKAVAQAPASLPAPMHKRKAPEILFFPSAGSRITTHTRVFKHSKIEQRKARKARHLRTLKAHAKKRRQRKRGGVCHA